ETDDQVLAVARLVDLQAVGEGLERAADVRYLELLADRTSAALFHRAEPQLDPTLALAQPKPHTAVGEASRRGIGDRIGDEDRIGYAVDREIATRRQDTHDAGQHRLEQLRPSDRDLGSARLRHDPSFLADAVGAAAAQRDAHRDFRSKAEASSDAEAAGERCD